MSPQAYEQAVSAAQAIMRISQPDLLIDGRWGRFTQTAYSNASRDVKDKVDAVVRVVVGGSTQELQSFRRSQEVAIATAEKQGSHNWRVIFNADVIPAAKRRAQQEGFANPNLVAAHLSHESGNGSRVSAPFNWAGIKAARGEASGGAVSTNEVVRGQRVSIKAEFRAFKDVDDFVNFYFTKLLRQWPKVRSAKTPSEFTAALKVSENGGYATERREIYTAALTGQLRKYA